MTETERVGATDPTPMLEFLRGRASERMFRLLVAACYRRIWVLLPADSQDMVGVLERFADAQATAAEYRAAWLRADAANRGPDARLFTDASFGVSNPPTVPSVASCLDTAAVVAALAAVDAAAEHAAEGEVEKTFDAARAQEQCEQARVVRDVFGDPFRPVVAEASWRTSTVVSLARTIYDTRSFELLPVLADALQDAGCNSDEVLDHCRGQNIHVRGCYVVDLVLGME